MKINRLGVKYLLAFSFFFLPFYLISGNIILEKGNKGNRIEITKNTYSELAFSSYLSAVSYTEVNSVKGAFTRISIDGYGNTFKHGSPELPVLYKLIELPFNTGIKIKILSSKWIDIDLAGKGVNSKIYPVQPPVSKNLEGDPPFVIDASLYQKDDFISYDLVNVQDLGMLRGLKLARLAVSPFAYNPVKNILRVYYDIEASVQFENPDIEKTLTYKKFNESPFFQAANSKIFNYKDIINTKDTLTQYPVKYVIVSPVAYQAALQPFVEWKTKKGFKVIEAYTNNPSVGTTSTSIKNYLKGLYNAGTPSDPPPSFVLLVGDVDQVPAFNGTTGSHVTDLYYCEYTGDFMPEMYYGRFSCTGVSDLQPQIDKTLEYEQYQMPDDSFLNEVVMVAGYDASMSPTYANGQINYGTTQYFNSSNGITSHTYLHPAAQSNAAQIIQDVSNGCAYANYTAHGSPSGWANPSFSVSDVANLQNNHKYPLMVGNACQTNTFDEPVCFGEALLRANGKGALGYIGGSNNTYWDEDFYWSVGAKTVSVNPSYDANALGAYDRLFHTHGEAFKDWYVTQDQMIFAGNLAVTELSSSYDYYWEIYHLMGDPSLMVYFSVPPQLNCTYNPLIILGSTTFTVNTEPYAYVALSMNGVLHGAALADASGVADITITPFTSPGTVDVVGTKQNRKPFISTVAAASPTGPYVMLDSKTVNDAAGNNNSIPEANENVLLSISLKNFGANTSVATSATLTTSDAYITITDNTQSFGDIAAGGTSSQNDAYAFTVAGNIPDKHIINFTLTISDNSGNNWTSNFSITAHAPVLSAGTILFDDLTGGNNNGRLDPGETVVIIIKTNNNGLSDAVATTGTLTSANSHITVNTGSCNIGNVTAGGFAYATFSVTVSSSAINGELADFDFTATSGQYNTQKTYTTMLGMVNEDWETGNFNKFSWAQGGNLPWQIVTANPYEGVYCARSGAISDQQSSVLSININVTTDDSISFYRKVSSESGYDYLKFYIDNVLQKSWSGTLSWGREAFPVTAGQHTFKWEYSKDYSMLSGSDCAWIDFIMFPPCSIPTSSDIKDAAGSKLMLNVFPNPAKTECFVDLQLTENSTVDIALYNTVGAIAGDFSYKKQLSPGTYQFKIDLSEINSGLYFLIVKTDEETLTRKVIVNK